MTALEQAIEALRGIDKRGRTSRENAILAAWDESREMREAERDLVEACVSVGQTRLGDSDWVRHALAHVARLRELRKPKLRWRVRLNRDAPLPRWDVFLDDCWLATFATEPHATAWMAAQEQRP